MLEKRKGSENVVETRPKLRMLLLYAISVHLEIKQAARAVWVLKRARLCKRQPIGLWTVHSWLKPRQVLHP